MTNGPLSSRRWLVWGLRIVVLAVVCIGVGGTVRSALGELAKHEWKLRPAWLLPTGAWYVLGLMPMAWFWNRTLAALGYPAPLPAAVRAYYLGQLGKYVPGKAMVLVLRVAAVRKWMPSMRIALVSIFIETLTMMAAGAFLAFVLAAAVLRTDARIWLIALAMAIACGVPTLPPFARWFARFGAGRFKDEDTADIASKLSGIDYRLLASGWVAAVVCWTLLGVSLWSTLRAIGVDQFGIVADLPVMITCAAIAVVAGFLSMLPGGLGVRDLVLLYLLAPVCGKANAAIATVLMRLVWLVSELIVCGILYIGTLRNRV